MKLIKSYELSLRVLHSFVGVKNIFLNNENHKVCSWHKFNQELVIDVKKFPIDSLLKGKCKWLTKSFMYKTYLDGIIMLLNNYDNFWRIKLSLDTLIQYCLVTFYMHTNFIVSMS